MMENPEETGPRFEKPADPHEAGPSQLATYESLGTLEEKLRAILAAVGEPVTVFQLLFFAGIDGRPTNGQYLTATRVCRGDDVEEVMGGEIFRYQLNQVGRDVLAQSVDMRSVNNQIANRLIEQFHRASGPTGSSTPSP